MAKKAEAKKEEVKEAPKPKEPEVKAAEAAVEAKEDLEIHYHAGNPMKVIRDKKGEIERMEPL